MALDPRQINRHKIVGLLIVIAIGLDDNYLPNGYDPAEDRTYLTTVQREAEHLTRR